MPRPVFSVAVLAIALGLVGPASARAQLLVPATVTGSSAAPVLDSTFGVVDEALNFGGSSLTRDGISFRGATSPGGLSITLDTSPFTVTMSGFDRTVNLANANVGADPLFETEIYTQYPGVPTGQRLTIDGLDSARTYQFQFLHGDARTGSFNDWNKAVTFTDSHFNVGTTLLQFGNAGNLGRSYAVITVLLAGSTSLTYDMVGVDLAARGPSMSGLVVSSSLAAIPEPSGLALGSATLLGAAGLAAARRLPSSRS